MSSADVTLHIGDSRPLNVAVTDLNNAVVDLTGSTIKWALVNNGATILVKSNGSSGGITITNATGGLFAINVATSDTQNLTPGAYTHECRLTDSSGTSSLIFSASFTVLSSNV